MHFQRILAFVAFGAAVTAQAAPVTFNFSGVVTRDYNYITNIADSLVGMQFTGFYTVDLSNAQEPWRLLSQSGCALETAGVCNQNYGNALPVVTDWSVQVGEQRWQRLLNDPYYSSTQSHSTSVVKNVFSGQSSSIRTGDPGTLTNTSLSLNIIAEYLEPGGYIGGHLDAPDISLAGSTSITVIDTSFTCRFVNGVCWNTPAHTGSYFGGYLTSWAAAGANEVPEPSTAVIFAVALGGLIAKRSTAKRQRLSRSESFGMGRRNDMNPAGSS